MLKPFRLLEPTSVAEASTELERLGEQAKVYAGGAELVLLLRHGIVRADYLLNIKRIPGLDNVSWQDGLVHIGATATHRRVETHPVVREHLPALAYAVSRVGNIRVRAQGTLGGNLCFADPHSDPPTALLVYESSVTVVGRRRERRLPLGEFLLGTYEVALGPDELLTSVQIKPLPPGWGEAFLRIEQFYRPTANVAVAVKLSDGLLQEVRLAVGCVGPKAVRLPELEAKLVGLDVDEAQRFLTDCRRYLSEVLEPVDDLLGSAEYKVYITGVLLSRALGEAVQRTGGKLDA